MIRAGLIVTLLILVGCSEDRRFEDFTSEPSGKGEQEFRKASNKCEAEKEKFSNLIQGREMGYRGEHTGYLGCMKLIGWSPKDASLSSGAN